MHAPPDFRISVRRFGAWRLASAVLAASSTAAACAWAVPTLAPAWWPALLVGCVGFLVIAAMARPLAAFSLRWDTQVWHLGPESSRGQEPLAGTLKIALDLGPWILLRFSPDASRRDAWLPVQRWGHEADWQALRCTVYGTRSLPVALSTSAAE